MLRLDGTCTWKCGAETKQTHSTGCWAKQGSVWLPVVLQCCPRPSLLAPRSLPALISVSEAGLELPEQKCPCWATLVLPEMCPKGTLLQPQATSGSWNCVCAQGRSWDVPCVAQDNRNPQSVPCAAPLVPHHFSTHSALALLVAVCPHVLVTAIEPVWISFSFIPSDTGCGHNKTHLITEMLRVAGRGNGSLHLGSARSAALEEEAARVSRVCKSCSSSSGLWEPKG